MVIALNDIAKIFTLNTGEENYFTDVLGSISIKNVIILPGAPLSVMSYSYIAWAQKKFSTKALWIFGDLQKNLTDLLVFLIGIIGGAGKKGFYNRIGIMIAAFTFKDVLYKSTLSIFKIVPRMMLTEALDYGEWKNGFRSEGTSVAAMQIIKKITAVMVGPFRNLIFIRIGYSLQAGFGQQTDRTKFLLFACSTLLPGLTGLLSLIPKLFYEGSLETRERMYEELSQMRALKQETYQREQESRDDRVKTDSM
jgi:Na+/melibiose symporter-like transporter